MTDHAARAVIEETIDWLKHPCEYGPPCGRCTYCEVRRFIERRDALPTGGA